MSTANRKRTTTKPAHANTTKSSGGRSSSSATKKTGAKSTKEPPAPQIPPRSPLFGARVKSDLTGVALSVVAVVLLVIVLLPEDAVGARLISNGLHLVVGVGAVLLPFLLLGWAATFFVKQRLTNSPLRLAIGLAVIYVALIALLGALTPQAVAIPSRIFEPLMLTSQGGYLGGGIAWALLSLVGFAATLIILIGLILMGLVLIGLSISGLVDWLIQRIKGVDKASEALAQQGGAGAFVQGGVPTSGSAYQMGPQGMGATPASGGKRGGRYTSAESLAGTQAALQLQDTLYYPAQNGQGAGAQPEDTHELGSTRRRMAGFSGAGMSTAERAEAGFAGAQTILLDDSAVGAEAAALDEQSLHEEGATASDATLSLSASEKQKPGKEKGKSGALRKKAEGGTLQQVDTEYTLPSVKLLRISQEKANTKAGASELRSTANRLQETLEEFRVDGEVVGWIAGPTVTLYKISLGEGVRLNRVTALQSDIQLALAAQAIRIVAPIPGTSLVGIEIPNRDRNKVLLGDVLDSARDSTLALAIGKDVEGESIVADLASMPHLLIGGTTGSGKSVAVNSIIMSLLMRTTPDEVRMIMIDPKRVELTLYNGIPHLYVPVVTDAGQAASALAWCVAEMDRRLKLFEKHAVKNIKQFNVRVAENLKKLAAEEERTIALKEAAYAAAPAGAEDSEATISLEAEGRAAYAGFAEEGDERDVTVEQENLRCSLPYLVIVIDELADLMMLNGKEVEGAISRLAQLARAAGLHLIVATQRPSTNVITGLIKANIVNRIAFTVASSIDSRVILDTPGAEDLIGLGDMLFSRPEYSKPIRIQGCFVSEPEIETVVGFWRTQGNLDYHEEILLAASGSSGSGTAANGEGSLDDDPLIWEAAEIVVSSQLGSTSTLQRRLKVGYARAGRIMDMLEMKGVVGPPNGSKPREVLLDDVLDLETLRAFG